MRSISWVLGLIVWVGGCGASTAAPPVLRSAQSTGADAALPTVVVTISQWTWEVMYADGARDSDLRLAVGRPVRLEVRAFDVDHRLVIEGTDISIDVPAHTTTTWRIEAMQPAELHTRCEVGCPTSAEVPFVMPIHVLSAADYDAWHAAVSAPPTDRTLAALGRERYAAMGCPACHAGAIATNLWNLSGSDRSFPDGTSLHLDDTNFDAYIRESILEPNARLSGPPIMPAFTARPVEIDALVAYLRCRSDDCSTRSECSGACE